METKWSKVLSADSQCEYESWDLPEVGKSKGNVKKLEQIQQQAYQHGFEEGRKAGHAEGLDVGQKEGFTYGQKEGLTQGKEQIEALVNQYQQVIQFFEKPLVDLDEEVENELVLLATEIAKQVIKAEVKTQPELIVNVIRDCLALLPLASRGIKIKLNPVDAAFIREGKQLIDFSDQNEIVEDPGIAPGGCEVVSEISCIDATLNSRIKSAISSVLNVEPEDVDVPLG